MITSTRKKYIVHKLDIKKKHQTFEIKIPNHARMVTGLFINSYVSPTLERIGTISFQSQMASDIFLSTEVYGDNAVLSDDSQYKVFLGDFDPDYQYASGQIPKKIPVWIEGDTAIINGFFKASHLVFPYPIHIIVEYEEVEQRVEANKDERVLYS